MKSFLLLFIVVLISQTGFTQEYPDSWEDGEYYEVNGKKLYTVSFGEGAPLFFISGGPGGAHVLHPGHRLVVDLEGAGQGQARRPRSEGPEPERIDVVLLDAGRRVGVGCGVDQHVVASFIEAAHKPGDSATQSSPMSVLWWCRGT